MKIIATALLLLSIVGCSTADYRGPASQQPLTDIEKYERRFDSKDRFTGR